jgi:hypothetical protein
MTEETDPIARHIREVTEGVRAPKRLHARIAEETARRRPARRRRLIAIGGGVAGAVAAAVVALVLVLGSGAPAMDDAVALALRPPSTGAPAVDPADPGHVEAEVGGVRFPNYEDWRPVGKRTDDLDGRRAVTVAYQSDGGPVSYTIVDGAPLDVPGTATWHEYSSGYRVAVLRDGAERVITWEQGGRTCIIAGDRDDVTALLRAGQA